jgi:hypothetical protein
VTPLGNNRELRSNNFAELGNRSRYAASNRLLDDAELDMSFSFRVPPWDVEVQWQEMERDAIKM